jgi:sugar lactone lactonase YvrE
MVGLTATTDALYIAANNRIRETRFVSGILSTIAGNGLEDGVVGDGMAAREAPFHRVTAVGIGAPQIVLIGEGDKGRIWDVDPRVLSLRLLAEDRETGRAEANNRAAQIRPKTISALVVDTRQNLYVADARGHRIFRAAKGERNLTPFAGTGATNADHLLGTYSGDGGSAASAGLSSPSALAVDRAGNLYIADTGNSRVRMVAAATGVISTVAGDGEARWAGDGGPAATASLNHPGGVALDRDGTIYVADTGNNRIRRIVRRLR